MLLTFGIIISVIWYFLFQFIVFECSENVS